MTPEKPSRSNSPENHDLHALLRLAGEISKTVEAIAEGPPARLFITPEVALPCVMQQAYSVEDVARIAAGCVGSPRERVMEAMRLLEAAEELASPILCADQSCDADEAADKAEEERLLLREAAQEIVRLATDAKGVSRSDVLRLAYNWCGRPGGENAQRKAYRTWASNAGNESAEIAAWQGYIEDHPSKLTPEGSKEWRKRWKSSSGRECDAGFLERYELPYEKGAAVYFRNEDAAIEILVGGDVEEFTPLLRAWTDPKQRMMVRDPNTGKAVSRSDRRNKGTRHCVEETEVPGKLRKNRESS
jgi:hypothetical protein